MSASRGGGRGGGRGGRGGAMTTRGGAQIPMGTMTWGEFAEVDKQKPSKSYPPMEERPILTKPSSTESRMVEYQIRFLDKQKHSIWWPVEENRRKKDLVRYSDRYQENPNQRASLSLQDDDLCSTLQKEAFPSSLWSLYMTAESKRQEKEKRRGELRSTKKGADWRRVLDNVEQLASGDQLSDGPPSEEEDDPRDEYEDDEEDDYADNYFDNGEDDDIPEEGGEGAEETYE